VAVIRDDHGPAAEQVFDEPVEEAVRDQTPRYRDTVAQIAVEWVKSILIAFVLFLFIRTFLVEAYRIPTGSMEESLLIGDFLLVNKAVYGARIPFTQRRLPAFSEPKRGDIVVFVPPHVEDQNYVKRLIGTPGDTVEMRGKALYLNGVLLAEPYAHYSSEPEVYSHRMDWQCEFLPANRPPGDCRPTRDNWGPVVVPPARYLMLGDNRDDSEDSRYWGFVDPAAIKGKPLVVYYSFQPVGTSQLPWFTAIRWRRIGHRPH
jgi:signal peptidase I